MVELVVLWAAVVGAAGRDELGRAISDLSAALDDAISCDEDSLVLELLCGTPDVITVAATSFQRDGARRRAPRSTLSMADCRAATGGPIAARPPAAASLSTPLPDLAPGKDGSAARAALLDLCTAALDKAGPTRLPRPAATALAAGFGTLCKLGWREPLAKAR